MDYCPLGAPASFLSSTHDEDSGKKSCSAGEYSDEVQPLQKSLKPKLRTMNKSKNLIGPDEAGSYYMS